MSRCRRSEQFVLTISENGYGKRTSSFEYRTTGRGGKGIVAMSVNEPQRQAGGVIPGRGQRPDHAGDRQGPADPLPVDGIRIAGRSTQGVIVFDTAEDEQWSRSSTSARRPRTETETRELAQWRLRLTAWSRPAGCIPMGFVPVQPGS